MAPTQTKPEPGVIVTPSNAASAPEQKESAMLQASSASGGVIATKTEGNAVQMAAAQSIISEAAQTRLEIETALSTIRNDAEKAGLLNEEEDPLDAFMAGEVKKDFEKELAETARKQAEDDAAILAGDVDKLTGGDGGLYSDGRVVNMELHCYICKKKGHTKKDCPDRVWDPTKVGARQAKDMGLEMACKHCNEMGHTIKECKKYQEDEKKKRRRKQYEVKALKRAEERKALKQQEEAMRDFATSGTAASAGTSTAEASTAIPAAQSKSTKSTNKAGRETATGMWCEKCCSADHNTEDC